MNRINKKLRLKKPRNYFIDRFLIFKKIDNISLCSLRTLWQNLIIVAEP